MPLHENSKVVIFDDNYEEVELLINTFQRQLIPSLYIKFDNLEGTIDKDCQPLKNVRLIFTDFIAGDLSTGDPKIFLGPIINAFDSTIDKDNGPFILVVWSAHDKFTKDFKIMLEELNYKFIIVTLDKKALNTECSFARVKKDLKSAIQRNPYFLEFLQWEKTLKDSASNILNLFSENTDEKSYKQKYTLLAQASVGKSVFSSLDKAGKSKGFYNTLTNLLNDEMEKAIPSDTELDAEVDIKLPTQINLNSKLLIDQSGLRCDENFPGNIYMYPDVKTICDSNHEEMYSHCGIEMTELLEEIFIRNYYEVHNPKIDDTDIHGIYLEISPYCDHAQKKIKKSRLLSGLLIKTTLEGSLQGNTSSIYVSEPLKLDGINSSCTYRLCFSFKHIMSINPNISKNFKPLFRLRKEFVNEIQHQAAYYLSRPGLSTVY